MGSCCSLFRFQLHHTGIKTADQPLFFSGNGHFNCTIQELKPPKYGCSGAPAPHFNCTIQELKLSRVGPKTNRGTNFNCTIQELKRHTALQQGTGALHFNCTIQELKLLFFVNSVQRGIFQLHHTGIKTQELRSITDRVRYFNCTIQELKPSSLSGYKGDRNYFNCTIQELKRYSIGRT